MREIEIRIERLRGEDWKEFPVSVIIEPAGAYGLFVEAYGIDNAGQRWELFAPERDRAEEFFLSETEDE